MSISNAQVDKLFPNRMQRYGFATEREAIRDAKEELGRKAKQGLMFIILKDGDTYGWLNSSNDEYTKALLSVKHLKL